jgi:hypothetical protein
MAARRRQYDEEAMEAGVIWGMISNTALQVRVVQNGHTALAMALSLTREQDLEVAITLILATLLLHFMHAWGTTTG